MEDAGLRYVREWISKCFFQDYILFKMHDLASSLAQNECSIISSQNHQFSKTTCHLSVISFFHQTLPESPNEFDHVVLLSGTPLLSQSFFPYQTLLPSLKKKMAEAFAAEIAKP